MTDEQKELNYLRACVKQSAGDDVYPEFVPKRVRMNRTVRPDLPVSILSAANSMICRIGFEYEVKSNKWGAVHAEECGNSLGLKPNEFTVIEWVENPHS